MSAVEIKYVNGEEIYICSSCGKNIYKEFIDAFLHDEADRCPRCGEIIDDIEES